MKYETDSRSEQAGCECQKVSDVVHRFDGDCPLFGGAGPGLRLFGAIGQCGFLHARGPRRIREAHLQQIRLGWIAPQGISLRAYQTRHRLTGSVLNWRTTLCRGRIARTDATERVPPNGKLGHGGLTPALDLKALRNHSRFMVTKMRSVYCVLFAAALVLVGCGQSESTSQTTAPVAPAAPPPQQQSSATLPAGHPDISGVSTQALPPGHPGMGAMGALPPGAAAGGPNPEWTVPKDWTVGSGSAMRRATFEVKGSDGQSAEVVVSSFPGDVGGLVANINRWRGQIGLGPIAPDEVSGITSDLMVNGVKATMVDFKADSAPQDKLPPKRMIVVTIPHEGNSWFFKITGDAPLIEAQKATFLEFVQSVKF